jgi:hypothetical protein
MFMLKYMDFLSRGASLSFGQVSKLDYLNVSRMDALLPTTFFAFWIWAYVDPVV